MNLATFDPATADDTTTRQAQAALKAAGYYAGAIDGQFFEKSRAALYRYHQDHPDLTAPTPATPVVGLTHLQQLILDCLAQYVGLVELVPNAKWGDPRNPSRAAVAEKLRKGLLALGCQPGWAYCISGARLVWREAYADAGRAADFAALDKRMSVSVLGSFNALRDAGLTSRAPKVGAILFLQHVKNGVKTGEGHAVVVTAVFADRVVGTGFNTSPAAGDAAHEREGDGVFAGKTYPLDFDQAHGGLLMRGFLNPS